MDALKLIAVFILFLALPFYLAHLMWWFWFWVGLAVLLGIFEAASAIKNKRTLSQLFWKWKDENPKAKWFVVGGMALFWAYLLAHLIYKI